MLLFQSEWACNGMSVLTDIFVDRIWFHIKQHITKELSI